MYKVRASSFSTLLAGCGKVNNKFEWKELDKMNDSHIKLAIEIYNRAEGIFVPAEIHTLDLNAGNENEPEAIQLYDSVNGTNFYEQYIIHREKMIGLPYERSNEWMTGTRDFGDKFSTYDNKTSTDKNVFDMKRFSPIPIDNVVQVNCYGLLYGTKENFIVNTLMPATFGQIKKFTDSKAYIEMLSDSERDEYQEKLEANYDYSLLPKAKRIDKRPVPNIDGFEDIVKIRVETMNDWIEKHLK